ncbi:MAG: beta-ketoacyl-ACP synthase III [Bacillota bacterium]|uniref:beta-ketoacyl-ACP synthase III n=1 Tax=Desulfurispora thermophila TaxID=265470 RepID=UPI00037F4FE0|nr:beta-ketoacyl-ACP synthase III [Desulfurispora thermophila]
MPELRGVKIAGLGMYAPARVLTNQQLQQMVDTSEEWIVTRTGIKERRLAEPEQATSDLALLAARQALQQAGVQPEELDLIIVATNTPDTLFPATACLVQDRLGAKKAGAFDLLAGCTGFIYALVSAAQFVQTGMCRYVLVVGAETLSRIINWQDRNTCVLFGDGAGAALLAPAEPGRGILASSLAADGSGGHLLSLPAGGSRQPASLATVEAGLHYVHMNGREVFKFAVKAMGDSALEALHRAGLGKEDLDFLIPHQANIRIIEAAAKRLGLCMDKVLVNVDRYGNTSTASVPIALYEAVAGGRIKAGDHVVLVGFGAGLTWAACAIRWD